MSSVLFLIISICIVTATGTGWDNLKITWGMDPYDPKYFAALPLTESSAIE